MRRELTLSQAQRLQKFLKSISPGCVGSRLVELSTIVTSH
jgi:hypothetical protein